MQIWHYDPATGVLLGEGTAQPSPLEPGQFLIPAHATTIAPPDKIPGSVQVFDGVAWGQRAKAPPLNYSPAFNMGPTIEELFR